MFWGESDFYIVSNDSLTLVQFYWCATNHQNYLAGLLACKTSSFLPEKVKTKGRPEGHDSAGCRGRERCPFKMGQVFEPFVFWVDSIVIFCMKIKHPKKKNMTFFVLVISCARDRFKIFILYERFR